MERTFRRMAIVAILISAFFACQNQASSETAKEDSSNPSKSTTEYSYQVRVEAVENATTPGLQSFAHASYNGEWVLFAGRTNGKDGNGGLHKQQSNYNIKSFPPSSFNTNAYCYNPTTNELWQLSFIDLVNALRNSSDKGELKDTKNKLATLLEDYAETFRSSNPQVTQEGEYLYTIGGYGTPVDSTKDTIAYQTFDVISRVHIPTMIKVIKKEWSQITAQEWGKWLRFGNSSTLKATGGELFKLNDKFYLAGGHNFRTYFKQRYLNCVYEFDLTADETGFGISANLTDTISDIDLDTLFKNPKKADSISKFRRRDGPIVPTLYHAGGKIHEGLSFYAGVFKYHFGAWNDAIHITPDSAKPYWIADTLKYNQKNNNVYSCADFGIYDDGSKIIHTFLPGGIGNGANDGNLSGFTNSLGHSTFNYKSGEMSFETIPDLFSEKYFGAESAFIPTTDVIFFNVNGNTTELIDGNATFKNEGKEYFIGYIYGGIYALKVSPGTYGTNNSIASNKVWKVFVKRNKKQ